MSTLSIVFLCLVALAIATPYDSYAPPDYKYHYIIKDHGHHGSYINEKKETRHHDLTNEWDRSEVHHPHTGYSDQETKIVRHGHGGGYGAFGGRGFGSFGL